MQFTTKIEPLKVGANLYLEKDLISMPGFPFAPDDVVNIRIDAGKLVIVKAEWYETIDWDILPIAWRDMPQELRQKITESGHAPIDI